MLCTDDVESADRKRQRLNSEQDESQTTPTENDNEQREDTEQTSSNSQSGMAIEATPLTESEVVPIEADNSNTETVGKFHRIRIWRCVNVFIFLEKIINIFNNISHCFSTKRRRCRKCTN